MENRLNTNNTHDYRSLGSITPSGFYGAGPENIVELKNFLTDEERAIIRLTYEEQLSADDAAKELKISKPAFKSKLYRSLRKMKQVSGAVGCV